MTWTSSIRALSLELSLHFSLVLLLLMVWTTASALFSRRYCFLLRCFSCSVVRRLLAVLLFHPGSVRAKSFSVVSPFLPIFIVAFAVCGMAVSISLLQCQSKAFSHGVHSSTRVAPLLLLPLLHLVSVSLRSSVLTLSSLASSRSFRYRVVVPYFFACRGS